ncbi:glycosyl hydrolase [Aspergillus stella-maris]|uniref:glycosyl hydrolase n=1 Tax=Aspergillus stella-maris TaxID=1810926 RepID=UPI003CCD011F
MAILLLIFSVFGSLVRASARNSTILNPILPGFHPDPSCIFVPELDKTFFCVSSSFLAFPGIPVHASRDLQNWNLVSNVLSRKEQLPGISNLSAQTGGLWAPSIRYHSGVIYVAATLVNDDKPFNVTSRWDNVIFTTTDPYDSSSWSDPIHFQFNGYDPTLFWDDNGQTYVVGAHYANIYPGIELSKINVTTGETSPQVGIWNGTGGITPEGPRLYKKDGYYYLVIAEGGTFLNHMSTIARSRSLWGPYQSNPSNPILTNANTSEYFQAVGHLDLFQDSRGSWWGVALSIRLNLETSAEPMGRETVLFPVTWNKHQWPVASQVRGVMSTWPLEPEQGRLLRGTPISAPDEVDFMPGSKLPEHFSFWWAPDPSSYKVSPVGHPNSLRLMPSTRNLTGSAVASNPKSVTFLGRRQVDTLFRFSIVLSFSPVSIGDEAGISVFAETGEHLDFGVVRLASSGSTAGVYFRLRGETKSTTKAQTFEVALPDEWKDTKLRLEIKAFNGTHYAFSAGSAAHESGIRTFGYAPYSALRPIFTGKFVPPIPTPKTRKS